MPNLACQPFVSVDEVLESACACELNELDDGAVIEELIDDASDMLYVLSGGRVAGRCTRTVWPTRDSGCLPSERQSWVGYDTLDTIPLRGPNTEVMEVTIDGVVLNPSEYGLLDGFKLFRRVGDWPESNDLTKADTEVGTFTITYRFDWFPNRTTKRAAIELICQMIKEEPRVLSRLRGVVSANVQGVSVTMDDRDDVAALGLPEVNRFLDLYAPRGLGALGVYSPELNHGWILHSVYGPSGS